MSDIIELKEDGIVIQVQESTEGFVNASGGDKPPLPTSFQQKIEPVFLNVSKSIANIFQKANEEVEIPKAEVTLNLGFSTEGNVFICKGKVDANISVKLTIQKKGMT